MGIFDIFKGLGENKIDSFPEFESIFDSVLVNYKEVFFPVCSIRLEDIKKECGANN